MWKNIGNLLLKSTSNVLGIDIGTGSIKIVELFWKKNNPFLKSFGIKTLPSKIIEEGHITNSDLLAETLSQLLATIHTLSKHAIVAVGGRGMFARELVFPVMTRNELQEAIKWDLDKYIPYIPNSYFFDFSVVEKGDLETGMKVLVVAAPHELINSITSVIKNVGLLPIAVDVEPLALYRTFTDAKNSMIIDVGNHLSQFTVFQKGRPVVIRNISIGGQRMTEVIMEVLKISFKEAEHLKLDHFNKFNLNISKEYDAVKKQIEMLLDEFNREIRRTAEYCQLQNSDVMIDKIYITGGGSKMNYVVPYLATQLDLPLVVHDPLTKLQIPASFDRIHLQQISPQMGTAIGLSLRGNQQ